MYNLGVHDYLNFKIWANNKLKWRWGCNKLIQNETTNNETQNIAYRCDIIDVIRGDEWSELLIFQLISRCNGLHIPL